MINIIGKVVKINNEKYKRNIQKYYMQISKQKIKL